MLGSILACSIVLVKHKRAQRKIYRNIKLISNTLKVPCSSVTTSLGLRLRRHLQHLHCPVDIFLSLSHLPEATLTSCLICLGRLRNAVLCTFGHIVVVAFTFCISLIQAAFFGLCGIIHGLLGRAPNCTTSLYSVQNDFKTVSRHLTELPNSFTEGGRAQPCKLRNLAMSCKWATRCKEKRLARIFRKKL